MHIMDFATKKREAEVVVRVLRDEGSLVKVLALIPRVCKKGRVRLSEAIFQVTASMQEGGNYITFVASHEGNVFAYLCGRRNGASFFILQGCSMEQTLTNVVWQQVREVLEAQGITEYEMLTQRNPHAFERFGFKLDKYYMTMKVGG